MIFEIGTQHSKIQVGLLSSAIVIATVDLDSETNSLVFRDVLACATNIEDLIKILNKQAYNLIAWGQLWTIVGMVFGLVTLVAYQKKHQFSKVHQIRSAALDKFLTYPEETQEKLQCIPCRAAAKEIICLPCKHAVACEDCWSVTPNKRECMVCKQAVTGTARILDS